MSRPIDGRDVSQDTITEVKKIHDLAKRVLDRLDLDWEVDYDQYDPGSYPGITIDTGDHLFVHINYDFHNKHDHEWHWMVHAWIARSPSGPPEPTQELIEDVANTRHEALADALSALLREEAKVLIDDLYIMDPSFADEG